MSIKNEFLKLLEEDREFRYAVAGLLGLDEVLKRLDRNEQRLIELREDMNRLREDTNRLREDMNRGFERYDSELAKLREDMNRGFALLERHISALGARWGLLAEEAFREGLRGVLEKEFTVKIGRWTAYDSGGRVYGYPSNVEVDIAVQDERVTLIEVKSHIDASDVYEFKRKTELYEEVEGRKPSRRLMVTPYAEEKALEAAQKLGIEIYTKV